MGAGNLSSDNHPSIMIIEPQTGAPGTANGLLNGQPSAAESGWTDLGGGQTSVTAIFRTHGRGDG
jgi:hypothetical protein